MKNDCRNSQIEAAATKLYVILTKGQTLRLMNPRRCNQCQLPTYDNLQHLLQYSIISNFVYCKYLLNEWLDLEAKSDN